MIEGYRQGAWNLVPFDVLQVIAERLSTRDIQSARVVCQQWKDGLSNLVESVPLVQLLVRKGARHSTGGGAMLRHYKDVRRVNLCVSLDRSVHLSSITEAAAYLPLFSCQHLKVHELRELLYLRSFSKPRTLGLLQPALQHLAGQLTHLELSLEATPLDEQVRCLTGLTRLQSLKILQPALTSDQLHSIGHLTQLTHLHFEAFYSEYGATSEAILSLGSLSALRELVLLGLTWTFREPVMQVLGHMTRLVRLQMEDAFPIGSTPVPDPFLPNLTHLQVGAVYSVESWATVANLPSLRSLHAQDNSTGRVVANRGLVVPSLVSPLHELNLANRGATLTELSLEVMPWMPVHGLGHLSRLHHLRLSGQPHGDADLLVREITCLHFLRTICLDGVVRLTDEYLNHMGISWPLMETFRVINQEVLLSPKGFSWFMSFPALRELDLQPPLASQPLKVDPCDLPSSLTGLTLVTTKFFMRPLGHYSVKKDLQRIKKSSKRPLNFVPLRSLHIVTQDMSMAYMSTMLSTWTQLTALTIEHTGKGGEVKDLFKMFASQQQLQHLALKVSGSAIKRGTLNHIRSALPGLSHLSLSPAGGHWGPIPALWWVDQLVGFTQLTRLTIKDLGKEDNPGIQLLLAMPHCQLTIN